MSVLRKRNHARIYLLTGAEVRVASSPSHLRARA